MQTARVQTIWLRFEFKPQSSEVKVEGKFMNTGTIEEKSKIDFYPDKSLYAECVEVTETLKKIAFCLQILPRCTFCGNTKYSVEIRHNLSGKKTFWMCWKNEKFLEAFLLQE